jgi:FAD/FMN-containing dehydrogenase/uncharacterized membrane protein YhaH (DUF805 family)/SAM-dependent methyltransferase
MPLINLFFSFHGRVARGDFWYAILLVLSVFAVFFIALESAFGRASTWLLYVPLFWSLFAVSIKRYHDIGRSGWWLLLLLIPLIGAAWVVWSLGFRKGIQVENRYGPVPSREELDYFVVGERGTEKLTLVNDVTGLNPTEVAKVVRPTSVAEIQRALAESTGPVSIGGGRFSMGGQVASSGSLHLDMRGLNRVLSFSPTERWIRVQAGIRWCDIQRFLDPHDLSVKIMQTYANFTVGGSLNVNSHGRYMGLGPVILSVRSIALVLADGSLKRASPTENSELFYGAVGGYGGLGVIVEAELDVVPNTRVACSTQRLAVGEYAKHFRAHVRGNNKAVFHNADLYPPHYTKVLAQTWEEIDKPVTQTNRLMTLRSSFPLERYFFWAVSETPLGKWRREFLFDPVLFFRQKVHWRNYEAGYDLAELEPASRSKTTYVLQEYFVPIGRLEEFIARMAEVFRRHGVNVINVSIRHALADPGSLLAWAREEVFALVVYYKQGVEPHDRNRVGVWTRELIDAVLSVDGTYYLPYQAHATAGQFHRAYPRAREYFALKRRLDPEFRFRNVLWDKYYAPELEPVPKPATNSAGSEFREVFADVTRSDGFYRFLQNIFHLHPEDRFHWLIQQTCGRLASDKEIYEQVQSALPSIKPFLAPLTHALPALKKQKREMARQTLQLLGGRTSFDGYAEIGSVGRYISALRKHIHVTGPLYILNDIAPGNGLDDIMERGQYAPLGQFRLLDYQPLDSKGIAAGSIDLITCFIGLHHAPLDLLDGFARSIRRVLRPGGLFIIRDHDVRTKEMHVFVSLVHTVFNLGLGVSWPVNDQEFKRFRSADEWSQYLAERGFRAQGPRLLQENDPTDNTLMAFVKTDAPEVP